MAGLTAAYELLAPATRSTVLEAQQRVGGRVFTLREPFSDGLYAEAGAMRIPRAHDLTLALRAEVRPEDRAVHHGQSRTPGSILHGTRCASANAATPNPRAHFELADTRARPQPSASAGAKRCKPLLERIRHAAATAPGRKSPANYDQLLARASSSRMRGWSEGAIEMFGLLADQEALMNCVLPGAPARGGRQLLHRSWYQMVGGMDTLPRAVPASSAPRIRFGAKRRRHRPGRRRRRSPSTTRPPPAAAASAADYAIITMPFSVLRHVEVLKPFSRAQTARHPPAALRRLGQDPPPVPPAVLGGRRRHLRRRHGHRPADPHRLLPRPRPRDRPRRPPRQLHLVGRRPALGLARSRRPHHPGAREPRRRSTRRSSTSSKSAPRKMWHDDEFAGGAFALFDPGQQTLLLRAHHRARGPHPFRRRARLAGPRLDPGRHRIRASRRLADQRSLTT